MKEYIASWSDIERTLERTEADTLEELKEKIFSRVFDGTLCSVKGVCGEICFHGFTISWSAENLGNGNPDARRQVVAQVDYSQHGYSFTLAKRYRVDIVELVHNLQEHSGYLLGGLEDDDT